MTTVQSPTGCPVSAQAEQFDPFRGPYHENPADALAWARKAEPVFYSPVLDYWIVTRYADIRAIFKDSETFSASIALDPVSALPESAGPILASHGYTNCPTLVNEDPPEHMARRRALNPPFQRDNLERIRPATQELVSAVLDKHVKSGRADFVNDILTEVSAVVGLRFLGVPEEHMPAAMKFMGTNAVFVWGQPSVDEQEAVCEGMGQFWEFVRSVTDGLAEDPQGDSLIGHTLRMAEQHPDLFDKNYATSLMLNATIASYETTTNGSSNAVKALLENRSQWDAICEDPSLIPNAVEECLRYDSSVAAWRRRARHATEIDGVAIPQDAKLLLVLASANHDESVFERPEVLDVRRENARRHLSFGFGNHLCSGAGVARQEMQAILEELTKRVPHIRLSEGQEFTYLPNTSFRGPRSLLVEWDPSANPRPGDRP